MTNKIDELKQISAELHEKATQQLDKDKCIELRKLADRVWAVARWLEDVKIMEVKVNAGQ